MVFHAPVWGLALLTVPLLFDAASEVHGRRLIQLRKKTGMNKKLHS